MLSDPEIGSTGFSAEEWNKRAEEWNNMSEAERSRRVYDHYDKNSDGSLDPNEFRLLLVDLELNLTGIESEKVFSRLDRDRNGKISFEEFYAVSRLGGLQ